MAAEMKALHPLSQDDIARLDDLLIFAHERRLARAAELMCARGDSPRYVRKYVVKSRAQFARHHRTMLDRLTDHANAKAATLQ